MSIRFAFSAFALCIFAFFSYSAEAKKIKKQPTSAAAELSKLKLAAAMDASALPAQSIYVGDVRTYKFPSIKRMAVGNGKVLNAAAISATEILVIAEAAGSSVLTVWEKNGQEHRLTFQVNVEDTSKSLKELTSLLNDIPNIKMRVVGDKVVVEGQDLSGADQEKLEMLAKQFPNLVNMTNNVTWEKMIAVDVKIIEFNKNALKELGVQWSPSLNGPAAGYAKEWINNGLYRVGSTAGSDAIIDGGFDRTFNQSLGYFGIVTSVTSQINLMLKNGKAILLAEPKLSARSGSEAHFLAGGEIPLPVKGDDGQLSVFYKEYGIVLDIKPEAGGDGTIRASVKAEVSSIDSSVSVGGFPGFLKRQTNTEVNLKEEDTLVISGLVSSEMSKEINKVPLLGDLPILGHLFRSESFRNKETELVFFVTPRLVTAQSSINKDLKKHTDEELEEVRKFMYGSGTK